MRNEFPVQNSPIKLREYIHELPHTQASRVNLPATLFSGNFIQIKGLYIYILLKIIIQAALMVLNTDFFLKQTFKGEKQDHIGAREYILKMYMQQNLICRGNFLVFLFYCLIMLFLFYLRPLEEKRLSLQGSIYGK